MSADQPGGDGGGEGGTPPASDAAGSAGTAPPGGEGPPAPVTLESARVELRSPLDAGHAGAGGEDAASAAPPDTTSSAVPPTGRRGGITLTPEQERQDVGDLSGGGPPAHVRQAMDRARARSMRNAGLLDEPPLPPPEMASTWVGPDGMRRGNYLTPEQNAAFAAAATQSAAARTNNANQQQQQQQQQTLRFHFAPGGNTLRVVDGDRVRDIPLRPGQAPPGAPAGDADNNGGADPSSAAGVTNQQSAGGNGQQSGGAPSASDHRRWFEGMYRMDTGTRPVRQIRITGGGPGRGPPQISVNGGPPQMATVSGGPGHNGNNPSGLPVLPPLEPRPLPNQTSDDSVRASAHAALSPSSSSDEHVDLKTFECSVCYEYMENPVSCGSPTCDARFCRDCLLRVLREGLANRPPGSSDPDGHVKCPHCRSFFGRDAVRPDLEMQRRIGECTETVTCPYAGCGASMPIGRLKGHEAGCGCMRVRCRYADWGCQWSGKRGDLSDHETDQCEFARGLGVLVERFRQSDARHNHVLQQHHMQLHAASQMLHMQGQRLMALSPGFRNPGNFFNVAELAYKACCFPARLRKGKDSWGRMVSCRTARKRNVNVLLLAPSAVLVSKVALHGGVLLSNLPSVLEDAPTWAVVDSLAVSLCASVFGVFAVTCFYIDASGPGGWHDYVVGDWVRGRPLMRDLAGVCLVLAHWCSAEHLGLYKGAFLWGITALTSVGLASFASAMVELAVAADPDASDVAEAGRTMDGCKAREVVVFGLRYGLMFSACDASSCLLAVAIVGAAVDRAPGPRGKYLRETFGDGDWFVADVWPSALVVLAGMLLTVERGHVSGLDGWSDVLVSVLLGVVAHLASSAALAWTRALGERLAVINHGRRFKEIRRAEASGGPSPTLDVPAPIGGAVLAGSLFLIACMALA